MPAPPWRRRTITWLHDFTSVLAGDGICRTVSFHGIDAVWNRSEPPLVRTFTVDTVPPVIKVDVESERMFSGTVSDGSGVQTMLAIVLPPDGILRVEPVVLNGTDWSYVLQAEQLGEHQIQIVAIDLAAYQAESGDIGLANVSMVLEPVGPGDNVTGSCSAVGVTGTGYDRVLTVDCSFQDVPVNTYSVAVTVYGDFTGGSEDVVVIYDPSLGSTVGGGWFYWPGTQDKTVFGYIMNYSEPMTEIQGSLLLIRHLADGRIYRLRSNTIEGLSIGDEGSFVWATFTSKGTYLEPGWVYPVGEHTFLFYVEDHDDPGGGVDRVWVEVRDQDDLMIPAMSMVRPGSENAVLIEKGNIVVPFTGGPGNQPPTADFSHSENGLTAEFTDLSSDPDGSIAGWVWDFGDGVIATNQNPVHNFAAAGAYEVSLTVTDDDGMPDSTSQRVVVGGPDAVDLQISIVGADVELSWPDVGGEVDHYEVWRSRTPYFTPGDAGSEKIAADVAPTPGGWVNYLDITHHLAEPEVNDYYLVLAIDGSDNASAESNRVAAIDFNLAPGQ